MSILLQTGDAERIDEHIRCLINVLQSVAGDDKEANPYQYARYLRKQLKKFSPVTATTPSASTSFRRGGNDNNRSGNSNNNGVLRLDVSGVGAGSGAWPDAPGTAAPYSGGSGSGSVMGSGSLASPDSYQDVSMAGVPGSRTSPTMPHTATGAGNDVHAVGPYLSGLDLNFSLNYFVQTIGNPSFAKATPPPEDHPPHPQSQQQSQQMWWQNMYPVSTAGSVPDGSEWPMVVGMGDSGAGTHSAGAFSPDMHQQHQQLHHLRHPDVVVQRAGAAQFHHMDVNR